MPLVHRVQDAAVYGLQAIAHIRQGTGYDNGHGIIQKCRFDLLLDIAHNDLRARTGHHDNIFFHSTHLSDCFKALLQKLHRKSSLYHQNIKNKIHQRLAAAEISTVIRGGNRLPTRSGRTMCAPTGAAAICSASQGTVLTVPKPAGFLLPLPCRRLFFNPND